MIRPAAGTDASAIAEIYNFYVRTTTITFEEDEVSPQEMAQRIGNVLGAGLPWLVHEIDGQVMGYAYASKWRERSAYRFSVESTVYLRDGQSGKGLARPLYAQLLKQLRDAGRHVVIGGIALPNAASIRLHEHFGFKQVATFTAVGRKFERWIDVGYWELVFD